MAICEANCLLRSSLYLAILRSEMVFEPEPKVEKMKKLINDQIFKKIYFYTEFCCDFLPLELEIIPLFSFMLLKSTKLFNRCLKMFVFISCHLKVWVRKPFWNDRWQNTKRNVRVDWQFVKPIVSYVPSYIWSFVVLKWYTNPNLIKKNHL